MNDLSEKMDEVKDHVRQRQAEMNEMKKTIQTKANKGIQYKQEVDRVGGGNRSLERQTTQRHVELRDLVNQKSDKERQGWVTEENLRKGKNDMFNGEKELAEAKKEEEKRQEELTYNNQEIERQQTKLNQLNTEIEDLQREEKQIQEQLKV